MAIIEYNEQMVYGLGYNSLTGEIRGEAIQFNHQDIHGISDNDILNLDNHEEQNNLKSNHLNKYSACGQKVSLILQSITSNEQLSDFLNVSGSGSFEVGFGPIGFNLSAKGEFCKQNKVNRYSTYLIVKYVVRNAARIIKRPQLSAEALHVLKEQGVEQFRKKYGDEFVVGFITGGEYISIIEIESNSREERETIAGEISAGFKHLACNLSGEGQISSNHEKNSYDSKIKIQHYKSGGKNFRVSASLEQIVEDINSFAASVEKDKATNYLAITTDYDTLFMPESYTIVDSELQDQKRVLNKLAQKRLRYINHMSDIDFITRNTKQIQEKLSIKDLREKHDDLSKELEEIEELAIQCLKDYSKISDSDFQSRLRKNITLLDLPLDLNLGKSM